MKTGEIALFEKKGLFFKADVYDSQHQENQEETNLLSKIDFSEGFDFPVNLNMEVVDVEGNTGYITGAYKDAGNVREFPYRIKVWLLIEEEPVPLKDRP
ncbi:hypothetical protein [Nafulsella turpanensis]|uniref:hypothetical protein n=1 Tax=Nafulsella turpanensis TaxID=1265690 RepID=UPI000347512A|nr:hypothetical protein [Nafulsella turpanensis]